MIDLILLAATHKQRAEHAAQYNKYRKGHQIKEAKRIAAGQHDVVATPAVKDPIKTSQVLGALAFLLSLVVPIGIMATNYYQNNGNVTIYEHVR